MYYEIALCMKDTCRATLELGQKKVSIFLNIHHNSRVPVIALKCFLGRQFTSFFFRELIYIFALDPGVSPFVCCVAL